MTTASHSAGNLTAILAFFLWGLFPLYFKKLAEFAAFEIIAHRFIWTCLAAFILLLFFRVVRRQPWVWLTTLKQKPSLLLRLLFTASLMFTNFLTYVWAVNNDKVLEASFGYFICPLVSIVLAMVFLGERLSKLQVAAISLAVFGVGVQLVLLGYLPTVALIVSFSFALYGLLHKTMPILAVPALFLETLILAPPLLMWLGTQAFASSTSDFWSINNPQLWLLMAAGPITLLPLTLYNIACKRTALTTVSFLGYITPSMIFLFGVFLYHEPMNSAKLASFALIWAGLLIFSVDMWLSRSSHKRHTAELVASDVRISE